MREKVPTGYMFIFHCCEENADYYHKRREGEGQRVMVEIIISENDDNDGRPLKPFLIQLTEFFFVEAYHFVEVSSI